MDDMIAKVQEMLSTEEGKAQMNNLANALGMNNSGSNSGQGDSASGANFDISNLASILSQGGNGGNNGTSGLDLGALSGLLGGGNGANLGMLANLLGGGGGANLGMLASLLGGAGGNNGASGLDLSSLAGLLGGSGNGGGLDLSALSGMLGANSNNNANNSANKNSNNSSEAPPENFGGINFSALMNIQEVLASTNQADDSTINLLLSLKPHFSNERKMKIDQAIKMLKLFTVLPLLKDSGLLNGIFN